MISLVMPPSMKEQGRLAAMEMIFLIGAIRARIGTAETTPEGIALCISIAASLPCSFIEGGMTKLII